MKTNKPLSLPPLQHTSVMSGVGFDGKSYGLSYRFVLSDAGRSNSRRPRQSNDCTVRALAIATKRDYDSAYDILAAAGRRCGCGFKLSDVLNKMPGVIKLSFPAQKGEPRMNLSRFAGEHPVGIYIAQTAKHVIAIIDGVVFDTHENRPDRCVYTAWKMEME